MNKKWLAPTLLLLSLVVVAGCGPQQQTQQVRPDVQFVEPSEESGSSMATVVGQGPLVHTDQLLPLDAEGQVVGAGDRAAQINQVIDNLRKAVAVTGSQLDDIVKINIYAANNKVVQEARSIIAQRFPAKRLPAIMVMVGDMPHSDALIAMDAVAITPQIQQHQEIAIYRSDSLYGPSNRGHTAVLAPEGRVYVAGQADFDADELVPATDRTMRNLHGTLGYLGLGTSDVVRVKAWVNDISQASQVENAIAAHYTRTGQPVPPIVIAEWTRENIPTEIELIASRGRSLSDGNEVMSFVTPPWMSSSGVFARVVEVHEGDTFFTSGLYGDPSKDEGGQIREIFKLLGKITDAVGADYEHLAKATYYYTNETASNQLNEIRPEFYNPDRPPAASKIAVDGTGVEDAPITIDMIGVIPPAK